MSPLTRAAVYAHGGVGDFVAAPARAVSETAERPLSLRPDRVSGDVT